MTGGQGLQNEQYIKQCILHSLKFHVMLIVRPMPVLLIGCSLGLSGHSTVPASQMFIFFLGVGGGSPPSPPYTQTEGELTDVTSVLYRVA